MPARNAAPPSGPRVATTSKGRGGVAKRRAPGRTDKDGDLIMGTESLRGDKTSTQQRRVSAVRGATRAAGTARPIRRDAVNNHVQAHIMKDIGAQDDDLLESRITPLERRELRTQMTELRINGVKNSKAGTNRDGGKEDVCKFLERKGNGMDNAPRKGIRIKKSRWEGDEVIITVNKEEAETIIKLNTFMFAGSELRITASDKSVGRLSEEAKQTKEKIKVILGARYNVDTKLLNLSALGQDPGLNEMGIFAKGSTALKIFPALMAVCDELFTTLQQKRDAIASVSLADNALTSMVQVASLSTTFPDLLNLDLSRNKFTTLETLKGKFSKLQNLQINDNPIEAPEYQQELIIMFPGLLILNSTQVRSPEDVAAAAAKKSNAAKISPIPITTADFRDINQIGENFVKSFFAMYDTNRDELVSTLYGPQSTHSMSVNTSAPRSSDQSNATSAWAPYIKQSRNMLRITTPAARISRNYQGPEAIKKFWNELPQTRHPSLVTQADKYLIDCHPVNGLYDATAPTSKGVDGMIVMVHGEFEEAHIDKSQTINRSFSRTFLLGPGLPGGRAAICVVSDMLLVRAWSPLVTVAGEESVVAPATASAAPADLQQQMIAQVMQRTGMTSQYATLCLEGTNWNVDAAFTAFETTKAVLPPEAFVTS